MKVKVAFFSLMSFVLVSSCDDIKTPKEDTNKFIVESSQSKYLDDLYVSIRENPQANKLKMGGVSAETFIRKMGSVTSDAEFEKLVYEMSMSE